jgi:hypothetical protein
MGKGLTLPVKLLLIGAGLLSLIAGPALYLFPQHTALYFAWTIQHPLTPVYMGASYWELLACLRVALTGVRRFSNRGLGAVCRLPAGQELAGVKRDDGLNMLWPHPLATKCLDLAKEARRLELLSPVSPGGPRKKQLLARPRQCDIA